MNRAQLDVAAIFHAARELATPQERSAYLLRACADDDAVRARVEALLRAHESAAGFLEPQPANSTPETHVGADKPTTIGDSPDAVSDGSGTDSSTIHADAPGIPAASRQRGPEQPGATIDGYKLLERLGEGGFGTIWLAEQRAPVRRRVALKIIKLGMDTRQVIARFEAERQALAMMDHENIARVFDAGATETGRPYFVMELVRGTPITHYCDRNAVSIVERLKLFIEVCQAVQHAHTKGVIHRDIKPSNVMIARKDDRPVPKVIDFGIAKATSAELTEKTLFTEQRQFIGTPAYTSPEQAAMTGLGIDTRTDVYSLGVLLYELLTGSTPFETTRLLSHGLAGMQRIICEEEPPRPSTRVEQATRGGERSTASSRRHSVTGSARRLRGDLDWIAMKCLEKDRRRRYETANGLAMDIQRHLRNEPVIAGPPTAAYRVRKFVRRNRAAVLAAMLIAATLVLGIVGTGIGFVRANRNAEQARIALDRARDAEALALGEKAIAQRQAYSANMLGASDALERGRIDAARDYLNSAPSNLRGWEWYHLSNRLDSSVRVHDHQTPIRQVHVAPDGQSYYSVGTNPTRTVERWNLESGRLLETIPTDRPCWTSWLVAGGTQLVMHLSDTDAGAGTVEVWDLRRRVRVSSWPIPCAFNVSPDGALAGYVWQNELHLLDLRTGAVRVSSASPADKTQGWLRRLCFQLDGRRMAVEASLGQIQLLDVASLHVLSTYQAHHNFICSLAFNPDAALLASASFDGTIRITNIAANPPVALATLRGHRGWVLDVSFSPDGTLLASRGQDRTVRLWDVRTGSARAVFQTTGEQERPTAFLPDGQTMICADDNGIVHFWDVGSADASALRGHHSYVYPVLLSPDGATVYSGGWDGFVGQPGCLRVWDAATGDPIAAIGDADRYLVAAAVSSDGARLALSVVIDEAPRIEVIDTATGAQISSIREPPFEGQTFYIGSLALDPSGQKLAWVNLCGLAIISDTQTGATLWSRRLFGEFSIAPRVTWSPDGATFAICDGEAGTLSLWDAEVLEPVREWPLGHEGSLCVAAYSPDSSRIVTASETGIARVWDAATSALVHELTGRGIRLLCAAYSPDGRCIATGGNDNYISLWDAHTFEPVARLIGHEDYVYSLAWRADSQLLVSGSGDHTVRIWDTVPLKDRVQARSERRAIVARLAPMVGRLFDELRDAGKVVERVETDASLSARERQVALQLVLGTSIARPNPAASQPSR